jgi:AcrR family transcriptional regulator
VSIRDRQRAVTRDAIRDAAIGVASETGFQAMTMDKVAERAGVSPSTVYRYFADRDALLAAIVAWNREQFRIPTPTTVDEIADIQELVMVAFEANRSLNRAIVVSRVGEASAWSGRQERLAYWRQLLGEVTDHLDPEDAVLGSSVITYLTGGLAWLTLTDESGLDGAQAGRAAAWAIRTLIADLRARNEQARRSSDTTRQAHKKELKP